MSEEPRELMIPEAGRLEGFKSSLITEWGGSLVSAVPVGINYREVVCLFVCVPAPQPQRKAGRDVREASR